LIWFGVGIIIFSIVGFICKQLAACIPETMHFGKRMSATDSTPSLSGVKIWYRTDVDRGVPGTTDREHSSRDASFNQQQTGCQVSRCRLAAPAGQARAPEDASESATDRKHSSSSVSFNEQEINLRLAAPIGKAQVPEDASVSVTDRKHSSKGVRFNEHETNGRLAAPVWQPQVPEDASLSATDKRHLETNCQALTYRTAAPAHAPEAATGMKSVMKQSSCQELEEEFAPVAKRPPWL